MAFVKWKSGDTYHGGTLRQKMHGPGTYTYANGDSFTGVWLNGYKQSGEGTIIYTNGPVYNGTLLNGKRNGEGTYTEPDGDSFTGTFLDDAWQTGEGTITFSNTGGTYTGAWLNGERTGEGTYTWANGDIFTGTFVNGIPSGGLSPGKIPYFVGTATVEKLTTGDINTDALLFDSPKAWASNQNYDNGNSTTITYSFVKTSDFFKDGYDEPSPEIDLIFAFSENQQAAVALALEQFSNIANITFVEVAETTSEVGTLRFGFTNDYRGEDVWGWAFIPSNKASGGDVWIDSSISDETFTRGKDFNFASIMHEIGHALGLDHPFE